MVEFVNIGAWINKKQKPALDRSVRKTVLDVDKEVSKRSPVRTGRFKGNWQLGVGVQPAGYDWDKKDTKKKGIIGDTVGEHEPLLPIQAAGRVYYLVNNLPYADALEKGHSAQTNRHPAGIVGLTLVKFEGIVNKAVESVR